MPVATVNPDISQQRYELKTCEGGFVVLRQLSYGEQIKKQQMAAKMTFEGQGRGFSGGEFEFFQRKVTEFEFATCIVEHNLEDTEGKELSFASSNTANMFSKYLKQFSGSGSGKQASVDAVTEKIRHHMGKVRAT